MWHLFEKSFHEMHTMSDGRQVMGPSTRLEMVCGLHVLPTRMGLAATSVLLEVTSARRVNDGKVTLKGGGRIWGLAPDADVCKGCLIHLASRSAEEAREDAAGAYLWP